MDNEPALQGVSMMYLEIEWNANVVTKNESSDKM